MLVLRGLWFSPVTFSRLEMDTFDCFKDGIVLIIISSGILYGASETQYTYVKDRTKGFFSIFSVGSSKGKDQGYDMFIRALVHRMWQINSSFEKSTKDILIQL